MTNYSQGGMTPSIAAAGSGHVDAVKLLIEARANINQGNNVSFSCNSIKALIFVIIREFECNVVCILWSTQ